MYCLSEVESRTQGSRPRTQKNPRLRPRTALSRTDLLECKDRNARGQGQDHKRKCSPKKSSEKIFRRSPEKNVFQKLALHKLLTTQKVLLSLSRGQGNFRGLEALRPRTRTSKCVLEDSTSAVNNFDNLHKFEDCSLLSSLMNGNRTKISIGQSRG